jgi:hypothetical protein
VILTGALGVALIGAFLPVERRARELAAHDGVPASRVEEVARERELCGEPPVALAG